MLETSIKSSNALGAILMVPHEKLSEMISFMDHIPGIPRAKIWESAFPSFCFKIFLEGKSVQFSKTDLHKNVPIFENTLGESYFSPIYHSGKVIGLLFIFKGIDQDGFLESHKALFELLTPFMGTLMENSRMQNEMLHKHSRLSALYDISQKAESIIDLRDAYESLEEVVRSYIDLDVFSIYFLSSDGSTLESRSLPQNMPFPEKIPLGEGAVGLAAKDRKPHLTFSETFKSILILPVVVSGKLIGVVTIASRKPYAYKDEDIIGLRILSTQIASIDEMFKDLVRLRGFTQHILQSMNTGVLIFENTGLNTFSNSAMTQILRTPLAEGWSLHQSDVPLPSKLRKVFVEAFSSQSPLENEKVVLEDSFPPKTLELNAFPFRDDRGKNLGTAFFIKDITQIIQLEERLKRADRLSALGALAAGVAHEIRNPLTGMKMIVQLLMGEFPTEDPKREPLGIIQNEIDRLERIIVNLLDFARPARPQAIPLSLPDILNTCILLIQNQLQKQGIHLEKNYPDHIPHLVGDPNQLKQVFLNILTNAAQATKAGGKVSVRIVIQPEFIVTSISDTGIGIPQHLKKSIFDPFITTKDDGTGLGLSVALRIVEEHNGRIEVDSSPGMGSTFSVFLPQTSHQSSAVSHQEKPIVAPDR